MRTTIRLLRLPLVLVLAAAIAPSLSAQRGPPGWLSQLAPPLPSHASLVAGGSGIILRAANPSALRVLTPVVQLLGGRPGRSLPIINSVAIDLPNTALATLAGNLLVVHISADRIIAGAMERT